MVMPKSWIDKNSGFSYGKKMPSGVFSTVPGNFFSLLAGTNREHYAALLVLYYRLFQENTRGLERELIVREFMNYLTLHRESLDIWSIAEEAGEAGDEESPGPEPEISPVQELQFGNAASEVPAILGKNREVVDERTLASRFLKRFINTGWLGEETLADFTKVINITAWGKPFMKALADIDGGLKTEYESHVVTVYSMLCGETIKKDGHHAVLKAHEECRSLIDSLKVLSQSIKGYYDNLNLEAVRARAASALHEHYDLYMGEVLDKAYKRLKTSDNVSRYRQGIFRQVAALLKDDKWLEESAVKYMRILQTSREECRKKLETMLEEIRDDLRSVDPLEDEIDRRNAAYSRSSTEIIKAYIEPDSTVAGKIGQLIKAIYGGNEEVRSRIAHGLYRIRFLSPSTLAFNQRREEGDFSAVVSKADIEALAHSEKEFFERMKKRLSIRKIGAWLDEQGGKDRVLNAEELIAGEDSYIRFLYALLYGDSRNNFGYAIEENNEGENGSVKAADYVVPDVRFRGKKS
ncbi:MAG: DUF5716 family protein [Treponema sp.]|nr:DUF5716 family protein [Treponema sp.]